MSYCECWSFESSIKEKALCKCGEADSGEQEWTWEETPYSTTKVRDGVSVTFHPVYSQGTGMVSGFTMSIDPILITVFSL